MKGKLPDCEREPRLLSALFLLAHAVSASHSYVAEKPCRLQTKPAPAGWSVCRM